LTKKTVANSYKAKSQTHFKTAFGKYLISYYTQRPHSSIDWRKPEYAYFNELRSVLVAAHKEGGIHL
jgi:hypothetical protein